MTKQHDKYPNKADFEPNIDKNTKESANLDELPLSDPADSNATKVFRENEAKTVGENEPSAFSKNKEIRDAENTEKE